MAAQPRAPEPRRLRWIPLLYYYLATAVGLTLLLVGVIGGLNGLVKAAFPQLSDEVRYSTPTVVYEPGFEGRAPRDKKVGPEDQERARLRAVENARLAGYGDALQGLVTTIVAAPVFVWHLRQARRKDMDAFSGSERYSPEQPQGD